MLEWIDIHTHLNMLDIDPELAISHAKAQGVNRMITIGTCLEDFPKVLKLCKDFKPEVYGTLGVHPHDAKDYTPEAEAFILANLSDERIVAVGEIGLDFYYNHSEHEQQMVSFQRQLEIAFEYGLPVEIHTRDAEKETIEILAEFGGKIRGVIHCFTGSQTLAEEALKLGLDISVSGVVTFKKAEELRKTISSVPLDRLHVETDAPFLAPMPHRGKKNQPSFVVHTAEKVAELKGVSLEKLSLQCRENCCGLFEKLSV